MSAGLRFCLPDVPGRGAGLGNELIPWARAFLASQVVGATCLPPAFGLNQRQYWRHFGTPRSDWLRQRVLKKALPLVEFTEHDYLRHGGGDVVDTLRTFAEEHRLLERHAYVLSTTGMWGGMRHIAQARDFVASQLYLSRFAAGNLLRLRRRLDPGKPTVGIHVRLGDFGKPLQPHEYLGRFNVSLPFDWYRRVALSIHQQLDGHVQFLVVSDAQPEQLTELCRDLPCVLSGDIADSDCSDLLALAGCDMMVCSISSFSVWAAFLSRRPYLWYAPNLHRHPEGFLSIWGHEAGQQKASGGTQAALQASLAHQKAQRPLPTSRAWAVDHDGVVPTDALALIAQGLPDGDSDLVQYGVIRAGVAGGGVACT